MATTIADQARRNGAGEAEAARRDGSRRGAAGSINGLLGRALESLQDSIANRITADLDDRDPDYIRENLPLAWLISSLWFRGEVRNLGHVPDQGPVLMVGNHSGGNVTPDTTIFTLAFNTYFGVERRFFQLAHNLVLAMPGLSSLRKYGTVAASSENAHKALDSDAA